MITLELQPELESALIAEAKADGQEVTTLVENLLRSHVRLTTDLPRTEAEQARIAAAVQGILELRKDCYLDGLTTKELINEGRKY